MYVLSETLRSTLCFPIGFLIGTINIFDASCAIFHDEKAPACGFLSPGGRIVRVKEKTLSAAEGNCILEWVKPLLGAQKAAPVVRVTTSEGYAPYLASIFEIY